MRESDVAQEPERHFGQAVRVLRTQRGLAIEQVASAAGLTPDELRQLERGRGLTRRSSLWLDDLTSALGVPLLALAQQMQRSHEAARLRRLAAVVEGTVAPACLEELQQAAGLCLCLFGLPEDLADLALRVRQEHWTRTWKAGNDA